MRDMGHLREWGRGGGERGKSSVATGRHSHCKISTDQLRKDGSQPRRFSKIYVGIAEPPGETWREIL
jgi:hypothetical protein